MGGGAGGAAAAVYRRALVSCIDVMGFEKWVGGEGAGEVCEKLQVLRARREDDDAESYVVSFSDSTFRIRPIDSEAVGVRVPFELLVHHEMSNIAYLQCGMFRVGLALRGGFTLGDACVGEGMFFGPGVNRAYRVESRLAVYPRVIVDRRLVAALGDGGSAARRGAEERVRRFLMEGEDGLVFVDYLGFVWHDLFPAFGGELLRPLLEAHRDFVLKNIGVHGGDERVLSKYLWMKNYHNRVLRALGDRDMVGVKDREELAIDFDATRR